MAEEKPSAKMSESEVQKRLQALEQSNTDLQLQLAQTRAGTPLSSIPEHGAGVADEMYETWSQYDQELAREGEHPDQL